MFLKTHLNAFLLVLHLRELSEESLWTLKKDLTRMCEVSVWLSVSVYAED